MLGNFIGGGQVFLHKIRMFSQVFFRTLHASLFIAIFFAVWLNWTALQKVDWDGFYSYRKAVVTIAWDDAFIGVRELMRKDAGYITLINAKSGSRSWQDVDPSKVTRMRLFQRAEQDGWQFLADISKFAVGVMGVCFILIFIIWSKFGSGLKEEKKKDGSGEVLTPEQVRRKLRSMRLASEFTIGKMPLVKHMETRHCLITGSTGSGKTNLIHNLLPQVEAKKQPVIVIDQTGEMIAKYYNKERGDIIFNPFDSRGQAWDFWGDCNKLRHLEKFADTLIGFNSRQGNKGTTDFWEDTAQSIFVDCATYLQEQERLLFSNSEYTTLNVPFEDKKEVQELGAKWSSDTKTWLISKDLDNKLFKKWLPEGASLKKLRRMIYQSSHDELKECLKGKDTAQYFTKDNAKVASSIMSVLKTNIKPLRFISDQRDAGKFSIHEYLKKVNTGSDSWLFLANEPSTRELTIPINAALAELVIANLMKHDSPKDRKIWFVMDELAAFGRFPSLPKLMQEGRKYGTCVVAGMQSSSQLFARYGQGDASNLFALFKTKFAFQSDDPMMGKLYSSICGSEIITRQQKNTSFGANEFRDGVSYNEQQQEKPLVTVDDFANLSLGECYTLLPLPEVRLSKMQTPESKVTDKHPGFIEQEELDSDQTLEVSYEKDENLAIENVEDLTLVEPISEEQKKDNLKKKLVSNKEPQKEIINCSKNEGIGGIEF